MNRQSITNYLKYYGWEAVLALLMSFTMIITFAQGYYIPDSAADNIPLALFFSSVVLIYCFTGNYNKRTMILFSILFVFIVAGLFLALRAKGEDIVDKEGSPTSIYIYYIAAVIIPALVFLLSRARPGLAVLFVAGVYIYALNAFLQFETKSWCLIIFLLSAIVMYLMRQYRIMIIRNSTVEPEFGQFAFSTGGTVILSIVLALTLFLGVIRPLAPPTMDLKLIARYLSYQILEMIGVAEQYQLPDQETKSNEHNDEQKETDQKEETEEKTNDDTLASEGNELDRPDTGSSEDKEDLRSVSWVRSKLILAVIIIAAVIAAIVSAFILKLRRRKKHMERLRMGDPRQQVIETYRFCLGKFAKLGFPRPDQYTELEYADSCYDRLSPYLKGSVDLDEMTDIFMDARYEGREIPEETADRFAEIYPSILRNYQRLHGRLRYMLRFFIL